LVSLPYGRRIDSAHPHSFAAPMTLSALASLAIAAGLAVYLVYALIRPERF
jgi:K+-transporting ATPase KdpF subunit